jgi:hypothetical protein
MPKQKTSFNWHILTGGSSKSLDRYYDLAIGIADDGSFAFKESYDYPSRGEYEGREYEYKLLIKSEHFETFLTHMAKVCQSETPLPETGRFAYLIQLLKTQLHKGLLVSYETASAKANLQQLQGWLKEAGISYKTTSWSF